MLGKLIRSLKENGLWPLPDVTDVIVSVEYFIDILNKIDQETGRGKVRINEGFFNHHECPKVLDQFMTCHSIREKIEVRLTKSQEIGITKHGKATGLRAISEEPPAKRVKTVA